MKEIDWPSRLDLYNRIFNTNYLSTKLMLKHGYKRMKSIEQFSSMLGISSETLRQKMMKENIKINPPVRPR